jgi:hypothetical protein
MTLGCGSSRFPASAMPSVPMRRTVRTEYSECRSRTGYKGDALRHVCAPA